MNLLVTHHEQVVLRGNSLFQWDEVKLSVTDLVLLRLVKDDSGASLGLLVKLSVELNQDQPNVIFDFVSQNVKLIVVFDQSPKQLELKGLINVYFLLSQHIEPQDVIFGAEQAYSLVLVPRHVIRLRTQVVAESVDGHQLLSLVVKLHYPILIEEDDL